MGHTLIHISKFTLFAGNGDYFLWEWGKATERLVVTEQHKRLKFLEFQLTQSGYSPLGPTQGLEKALSCQLEVSQNQDKGLEKRIS